MRYEYTVTEYQRRFKEAPPLEVWPTAGREALSCQEIMVEMTIHYPSKDSSDTDSDDDEVIAHMVVPHHLTLCDVLKVLELRRDFPVHRRDSMVFEVEATGNNSLSQRRVVDSSVVVGDMVVSGGMEHFMSSSKSGAGVVLYCVV